MPSRLRTTWKLQGHVSHSHGHVGKHRKHPGGRDNPGGVQDDRINFDKCPPPAPRLLWKGAYSVNYTPFCSEVPLSSEMARFSDTYMVVFVETWVKIFTRVVNSYRRSQQIRVRALLQTVASDRWSSFPELYLTLGSYGPEPQLCWKILGSCDFRNFFPPQKEEKSTRLFASACIIIPPPAPLKSSSFSDFVISQPWTHAPNPPDAAWRLHVMDEEAQMERVFQLDPALADLPSGSICVSDLSSIKEKGKEGVALQRERKKRQWQFSEARNQREKCCPDGGIQGK
ncbi:uncharacterized protein LOC122479528 [Prionailurus bengalensis]|uniref:uncharacterized protein LOC122479528 n=1 Tax=Prionailurus bengalensis TaxID=37029 RepID=UPI001CA85A9E|nr:uncharacterized protein LOC122479528 [Prionailurus bengalensis]